MKAFITLLSIFLTFLLGINVFIDTGTIRILEIILGVSIVVASFGKIFYDKALTFTASLIMLIGFYIIADGYNLNINMRLFICVFGGFLMTASAFVNKNIHSQYSVRLINVYQTHEVLSFNSFFSKDVVAYDRELNFQGIYFRSIFSKINVDLRKVTNFDSTANITGKVNFCNLVIEIPDDVYIDIDKHTLEKNINYIAHKPNINESKIIKLKLDSHNTKITIKN